MQMNDKNTVVRKIKKYNKNNNVYYGGVYAFINILDKKVYVGETKNFDDRIYTHCQAIFSDGSMNTNGSNINMVNTKNKQFCISYFVEFDKNSEESKYWLSMETLVMLYFIEAGFTLYNGSSNGNLKDNLGKKRSFLLEKVNNEELRKKTIEFLNRENYEIPETNEIYADNWEDYIKQSFSKFNEELKETFEKRFYSFFDDNFEVFRLKNNLDSRDEWREFVDEAKKSKNYMVISTIKGEKDFYKLNKEYLRSLNEDIKCNEKMEQISLNKLIENNNLESIIYTNAGDYLGESLVQILANKLEDIDKGNIYIDKERNLRISSNNVNSLNDTRVCLWSLAHRQENWLRKKILNDKNYEDIYMIINYTGSKNKSNIEYDKNDERRNVKKISVDRNDKNKIQYPKEYHTEYINSKGSSMAFLISKFYYIQESLNGIDIADCFEAEFENGNKRKISESYKQSPYFFAHLKMKETLLSRIKEDDVNPNLTGIIVAKIPYPYVVAVDDSDV